MATAKLYGKLILSLFNKEIDWDSDTIKIMFCTSGYTPDQDLHQYKSSVTNEITSGGGYTAGGITLANKTITYTAGTNTCVIDADNVILNSSTISNVRYAVIYDDTPATDAEKPLIAYLDFGSDQSSDAGDFIVTFDSGGIAPFVVT